MAGSTWQKSYHAKNLLTKLFISFSDFYSFILIQFFILLKLGLVCFKEDYNLC